jgi:hypothetical protein
MSVDRFTRDTSSLIHGIDVSAGLRHETAVLIVGRAIGLASCLTLRSGFEFFAATTRKGVVSPHRSEFAYRGRSAERDQKNRPTAMSTCPSFT